MHVKSFDTLARCTFIRIHLFAHFIMRLLLARRHDPRLSRAVFTSAAVSNLGIIADGYALALTKLAIVREVCVRGMQARRSCRIHFFLGTNIRPAYLLPNADILHDGGTWRSRTSLVKIACGLLHAADCCFTRGINVPDDFSDELNYRYPIISVIALYKPSAFVAELVMLINVRSLFLQTIATFLQYLILV